jgi:hypothetical protein
MYLRGDPESALIDSFWQLWFTAIFLAGFCVLAAQGGCIVLFFARLKARREAQIVAC